MDLDLVGDFAGTSRASPWARSTACSSFIDCAGDLRSLRMVVGHYQPLADNGAPIQLVACTVRPNLSSAAGSEDKEKQAYVGTSRQYSTVPTRMLLFGLWRRAQGALRGSKAVARCRAAAVTATT